MFKTLSKKTKGKNNLDSKSAVLFVLDKSSPEIEAKGRLGPLKKWLFFIHFFFPPTIALVAPCRSRSRSLPHTLPGSSLHSQNCARPHPRLHKIIFISHFCFFLTEQTRTRGLLYHVVTRCDNIVMTLFEMKCIRTHLQYDSH